MLSFDSIPTSKIIRNNEFTRKNVYRNISYSEKPEAKQCKTPSAEE